ncbi:MAG: hypothetical protein P8Y97_07900 [Candidatus Lokiarchaeota archaeon]
MAKNVEIEEVIQDTESSEIIQLLVEDGKLSKEESNKLINSVVILNSLEEISDDFVMDREKLLEIIYQIETLENTVQIIKAEK